MDKRPNQQQRLLRLKQIIGDPKATPPLEPIIPISRTSWYAGIQDGVYPKPVKMPGGRASFWRSNEVYAVIEDARQDVQS